MLCKLQVAITLSGLPEEESSFQMTRNSYYGLTKATI